MWTAATLCQYFIEKNINFIYNRLFCCNHTSYCVVMVSVTSALHYVMSAPHYHPCYQSRSSMYIQGLIPRNFPELVEAVPIGFCSYVISTKTSCAGPNHLYIPCICCIFSLPPNKTRSCSWKVKKKVKTRRARNTSSKCCFIIQGRECWSDSLLYCSSNFRPLLK